MPDYSLIRFIGITKSYGGKEPIFSDLSLTINKAEFIFLTGVSGSGKTTLFKMLMGLDKPDQGQVFVGDNEVEKISGDAMPFHRRKIGMVFQDLNLLQKKTSHENIALPLRIAGEPASGISKKVLDTAKTLGIEPLLTQTVLSLSGGEQQLVALARAAVISPDIIMADEPTANLDQKMAKKILDIFTQLNKNGTTVMIATHDFNLIKTYSKRTLLIKNKQIVEVRPT